MRNHFFFILIWPLFGWVTTNCLDAQEVGRQISNVDSQTITVCGLVTERKKYSFTVEENGKSYQVRIAPNAPVGLRMLKPWYDWDNDRVIVDALPLDDSSEKTPPRIPITLPSRELFLISRFPDNQQMLQIMSNEVKRINFYLITPTDPGQHYPSEGEPYIAGTLQHESTDGPLQLSIGEQRLNVILGFQNATMNGFSILQLEPKRTKVTLTGLLAPDNQITAERVLFHPIQVAKEMANSDKPSAAK